MQVHEQPQRNAANKIKKDVETRMALDAAEHLSGLRMAKEVTQPISGFSQPNSFTLRRIVSKVFCCVHQIGKLCQGVQADGDGAEVAGVLSVARLALTMPC